VKTQAQLGRGWRFLTGFLAIGLVVGEYISWRVTHDINCFYLKICEAGAGPLDLGLIALACYFAVVTTTGRWRLWFGRSR
jgi:hypothetical protein